ADDVHDFRFAGLLAAFVDDGEKRIEPLGKRAGAHDAADVGRDDRYVGQLIVALDVTSEHWHGEEVVGGDVEEALNLAGVKIEGEHAVRAGLGDQVGDQLGRDGRAAGGAAVLPGIAEIGDDRRDAPRRGTAEGVDHDQQFHQVVVGRVGRRLENENILAAHVLLDLDEYLLVGEAPHAGLAQRDIEVAGDGFGQHPVGVARKKLHEISPAKDMSGLLAG